MIPTMIKTCEHCTTDFEYPEWGNWPGRFCSRQCLFDSMKTRIESDCLNCKKPVRGKKYCSQACYWTTLKGKKPIAATQIPRKPWNKGTSAKSGDELPNWLEKKVSYKTLHTWVTRKLGKPSLCQTCGATEGVFEWSNISREYKRDLSDWQRLCKSCHNKYDKRLKRATGY